MENVLDLWDQAEEKERSVAFAYAVKTAIDHTRRLVEKTGEVVGWYNCFDPVNEDDPSYSPPYPSWEMAAEFREAYYEMVGSYLCAQESQALVAACLPQDHLMLPAVQLAGRNAFELALKLAQWVQEIVAGRVSRSATPEAVSHCNFPGIAGALREIESLHVAISARLDDEAAELSGRFGVQIEH